MNPQYKFIESLSFEELTELSNLVDGERQKKNPEIIARNERLSEYFAEGKAKAAEEETYRKRVVARLKIRSYTGNAS
jgi:hypothetical protein